MNVTRAIPGKSVATGRYWTAAFALIAVAAITYIAGAGRVSLWDRDEAWYAQTSRQMVESGDWIVPRFLDQLRYAKPILIYWLQAGCMKVLGKTELAARLPSAIAMTLTLTMLALVIGRSIGPRRAMYTVLIFGTSAMVIASAKMCLTDSVLLVFVTAMELSLYGIYRQCRPRQGGVSDDSSATGNRRRPQMRLVLIFWTSIGLAGLAKGPVVLVLLAATLIALALLESGWSWSRFTRAIAWARQLRFGLGLLIIAIVVLPWLGALFVLNRPFLFRMLQEPFLHTTSNQDGMWVYPGYYVVTIWLTFFPWSLFLPATLALAWKHRRTPPVRFALALFLGNWIYAEIMVTKLPHYLLPSFAALAFLTATALIRGMRGQFKLLVRKTMGVMAVIWGMFVLGMALAPWAPLLAFGHVPLAGAWAFSALAVMYAIVVGVLVIRQRIAQATFAMGGGLLAAVTIAYTLYFPQAQFLRMPQQLGSMIVGERDVRLFEYAEPSVAFYQGGTLAEADLQESFDQSMELLRTTPLDKLPHRMIMTRRVLENMEPGKRRALRSIAELRGFNYNRPFGVTDVVVLERTDDKDPIASSEK